MFLLWINPPQLTWYCQNSNIFHCLFKPIICRHCKPKQIKFTSPKPSTTYYTPSSLAFTICFHILAQPDIFPLRQSYSLFPSFFFVKTPPKQTTYYQSTAFSLALQAALKLSTKSLRWFSFSSPEYTESVHVCSSPKVSYTLKMAIFLIGSKTVWLGFTW